MDIKRIFRHLLTTHWQVNRAFPRKTMNAIEKSIKASETTHIGEIRFVVEGALDGAPLFKGQSARERAIDVFSQMRIWDTEHNIGVLIYLLIADRAVEIIADRGIHAAAGSREWESICHKMETSFKKANYEVGVVSGIQAITQHLTIHFPATSNGSNELPNKPVLI